MEDDDDNCPLTWKIKKPASSPASTSTPMRD